MPNAVLLPKLGQTVEEAAIVKWHVTEGDKVAKGDVLFEIETDKAVLEAESFYDGVLLKVLVEENVVVPVSTVVAYIGEAGEAIPDAPPPPPAAAPAAAPVAAASETGSQGSGDQGSGVRDQGASPAAVLAPVAPAPVAVAPAPLATAAPAAPVRLFISPRAKALAKASVIDPSRITGSGPNGRIKACDVQAHLDANGYGQLRITPAAKRLAAKNGVDVLTVRPTGSGGRLMVHDVERAIAEQPKPMTKMRKIIAQRLTQSFNTMPHFYVTVAIDMTDLLAYRQELKDGGLSYTVTDFILESVIMALEEHPAVNSVAEGDSVRWRGSVDLGVAVSLPQGLVVPVIRDAQNLSLTELHDQTKVLATKARDGKLLPDEMSGSSFTVSNMGMMGVENFCAIINPGEAGILAVSSTTKQPAVVGDEIKIRSIMKVTLSVDHRIVDGSVGAEFVNTIKTKLEDVELWKSLT